MLTLLKDMVTSTLIKSLTKYILNMPKQLFLALRHEAFLLFGYRIFNLGSNDYDKYWQRKSGMGADSTQIVPPRLSRYRLNRVKRILQLVEKSSSVIDIGCGDFATLLYLRHHRAISDAVGVDISQNVITIGKEIGFHAIKADLSDISIVEQLPECDYIIATEIIEHLPNPEQLLTSLKVKFRKGLIVSIPNTGFLRYRLRLLLGRFPMQWRVFPREHLRFWTYKDFLWWVEALGYKVEYATGYQGIPILNRVWPNLCASGLIFLLKGSEE